MVMTMGLLEIILLAGGLAMDAFAVSVCRGLKMRKFNLKHALIIAAYFGGFQAGMPLIGYFLGSSFEKYITAFDHWIAFALLVIIGVNMIVESRKKEDCNCDGDPGVGFKAMITAALATSIDALAVGVTFAFFEVNVLLAVGVIGIITFAASMVGTKIGQVFGAKFKSVAEMCGGIVLVGIGIKILVEHLFGA